MWQTQIQSESSGRLLKMTLSDSRGPLRYSDVLTLLIHSADFRDYLTDQLCSVPFDAYRWETPPVTSASIHRNFECVLLDSPGLARTPDVAAFTQYFQSNSLEGVAVFPSLGKDAVLIAPCPLAAHDAYGHFAAFLRNAPPHQRHVLWKTVGNVLTERMSSEPIWLNTAGAGVSWLHVRLDSRPKYYGYSPYKTPPGKTFDPPGHED